MQTDMNTDVESTQSRQKKGQMKSIFMSDSDEEAIMEFVKQHEELYDKTDDSFKDKQKKERLWEQLSATRNLPVKTVKKWFDTQRTKYGKLTQDKQLRRAQNDRPGIPVVQPTQTATREPVTVIAKVQQPPRPSSASGQPTSYVVVDDQQPGTSRQMLFSPPSVAPLTTGGESAQQFWIIQSLCSNSQCAYVSADGHTTAIFTLSTSTSTVTSAIFHSS